MNPEEKTDIPVSRILDRKTLLLVTLAMIILLVYFYLNNIALDDLLFSLFSVRPEILLIGIIFAFLAFAVETVGWRLLLGICGIKASFSQAYRVYLGSLVYNLLIPSAGTVEAVTRVYMGSKEFSMKDEQRNASPGEVLSTEVALRFLGLLAFLPTSIIITVGIVEYFDVPQVAGVLFVLSLGAFCLVATVFLFAIAWKPETSKKVVFGIFTKLGRLPIVGKFLGPLAEPSQRVVEDFCTQFRFLAKNRRISALAFGLALIAPLFHWISIFFIVYSLGISVPLIMIAAINFLGGTLDLIPLGIPGMEGIKEIGYSELLKKFSSDSVLASSGAILIQIIKFYLVVLVGVLLSISILRKSSFKIPDLTQESTDQSELTSEERKKNHLP